VENRSFVERYTRSGNFQLRTGGSFETSVIFFQLQCVGIPELRHPNTAVRTSNHTQSRLLFTHWITIHAWLFILIVFELLFWLIHCTLVFMHLIFQQEHTPIGRRNVGRPTKRCRLTSTLAEQVWMPILCFCCWCC